MPFVVLKRDREKDWADSYGLFKTYQDALDYVEGIRDVKYKFYIAEANDEELEKSIAIKSKGSVLNNAIEHLAVRPVYLKNTFANRSRF